MTGHNCVAIASDLRLGQQALTVSTNFPKIFPIHSQLYVGLPGLATDVTTVQHQLRYKSNLYKLSESKRIEPNTFAHMTSSLLYEKRFGPYFIEPVIAGIDEKGRVFITAMDSLGCMNEAQDFVVSGTTSPSLYGMCEALWVEGMREEELFETVSQALMSAVDRDPLSGWGAVVHVITREKVVTRYLKARMD